MGRVVFGDEMVVVLLLLVVAVVILPLLVAGVVCEDRGIFAGDALSMVPFRIVP